MKNMCLALCALVLVLGHNAVAAVPAKGLDVRVLSGRADMVSGGSALIAIADSGRLPSKVTVKLGSQDLSASFKPDASGKELVGLVEGLADGHNTLDVAVGSKHAKVDLVNHAIAGPIFSGPHQTPFICETEGYGLQATDSDCSAQTKVEYFYRSTAPPPAPARGGRGGAANPDFNPAQGGGNPFKPYDPNAPKPSDLAMTTTSEGKSVPYIVRREMGVINRAVYVISILHEPGMPLPTPWSRNSSWNGKIVYTFGPGLGGGYHQGRNVGGLLGNRGNMEDGQTGDYPLAKGYALAGASLGVFGTSANAVLSAETTMMVKEHFIKEFGVPIYMVGSGRSGGSQQQHMLANNYPGLLDGIVPTASFADSMTSLVPLFDCELLDHAFNTTSVAWTVEQKTAVAGTGVWEYCPRLGGAYPLLRPNDCDKNTMPADQMYNPVSNPKGARCTYQDNMVNIFGRDPKTGFARRPFDNVGVQYGLAALNSGQISFDQFLDLNRRVGGHDMDGNMVAERTVADPEALRIAYQTGQINDTGHGLAEVPIIDMRPWVDDQPNVHDSVNTWITRARLKAANGTADNQVLHLYDNKASVTRAQDDNLDLLDQWIMAIQADTKPAKTQLAKVIRNKPADAMDACYTASLEKITDWNRCTQMFPVHSDPRIVAGSPMTADRFKCELKPIDAKDYKQPLSADQLSSLKSVFPQGVCDYGKEGVNQAPVQTWLSFPRPDEGAKLARNSR